MLHGDVVGVTVSGLIGELIMTLTPEGDNDVTAEVVDGGFEHQLTFVDGIHLCMRPRRHRPATEGALALVVPRSLTVTLVNCYGKWVRPDGEVTALDGSTVTWIAA